MEKIILTNLINNQEYLQKVLPFLKKEYFDTKCDRVIFEEIDNFYKKYSTVPNKDVLDILTNDRTDINERDFKEIKTTISELELKEKPDFKWLVDYTELFCKDAAYHNAAKDTIEIVANRGDRGKIVQLFSDAQALSFETDDGDYFSNAEERHKKRKEILNKIPSGLRIVDEITGGGYGRGTLNVAMAGTGVGKSIWLCHNATAFLKQGFNVLYITLELPKNEIGKRIDANILNVDINELESLDDDFFLAKINKIREKTTGNLEIRHFPEGSINVAHIKSIIEEVERNKCYKFDALCLDYLNLIGSVSLSRDKHSSYDYFTTISGELVRLAQECNIPVLTATQSKRDANVASNVGINDVSESFGITHKCDLFFALIKSGDMATVNQIMFKQLKNRYRDENYKPSFPIGLDKRFMRFYDVEQNLLDNKKTKKIEITKDIDLTGFNF